MSMADLADCPACKGAREFTILGCWLCEGKQRVAPEKAAVYTLRRLGGARVTMTLQEFEEYQQRKATDG